MTGATASDLAADVRLAFGPVPISVGYKARSALDALVARLRHAEARVDTLTRERDDQLKITHNVYGLLVDAKRERNAAEAEREQALKDAADYLAHLKAAEAALADTRRALNTIEAVAYEGTAGSLSKTEALRSIQSDCSRALAAGDKPLTTGDLVDRMNRSSGFDAGAA